MFSSFVNFIFKQNGLGKETKNILIINSIKSQTRILAVNPISNGDTEGYTSIVMFSKPVSVSMDFEKKI